MKIQIIAECGINHGGNINIAHAMIDNAVEAGADVIKFQTVNPELVYKKNDSLYSIFDKCRFKKSEWIELMVHVESLGREFLSTPGDRKSADLLDSIGVKRFKIASDSAQDTDFVNYVLAKNKPVIVSMGKLNNFTEINRLLFTYTRPPEYIFHCVSNYPTEFKDANLSLLRELIETHLPIGYSDHVRGYEAVLIAVYLGAQVIEKHFKFTDEDIDTAVSLNPSDFKKMVDSIRKTEEML